MRDDTRILVHHIDIWIDLIAELTHHIGEEAQIIYTEKELDLSECLMHRPPEWVEAVIYIQHLIRRTERLAERIGEWSQSDDSGCVTLHIPQEITGRIFFTLRGMGFF